MKLAALLFLGAATAVFAQTPAPKPATEAAPKITTTEALALQVVQQKSQDLQQLYAQVASEILRSHPGYHLNPQNPLSGELVKDPPPTPKTEGPKSPEEKK